MADVKAPFEFSISSELTGLINYNHVALMMADTKSVVATFSFSALQFENEPVTPEGQVSLLDKNGSCTGSFFLGVTNDFADLKAFSDQHGYTFSE